MTNAAVVNATPTVDDIVSGILNGSNRMAAKAISMFENDDSASDALIRQLYSHTGSAYSVGFTGPPGAGKSSIVDDVVKLAREEHQRVGVLAVDPNSPFSGGAILGDRIRMMRHTVDPDVFIRSMGSRGHLGGLALATSRAMHVFDALRMDYVLLETVGVGQSELEVAELADTTIVVVMPGLGDSVQTIKAGIMEIADIFVINKADHPAVQKTYADLKELLRLDTRPRSWIPPIVKTVATKEEGVKELWDVVGRHRRHLEESGEMVERRRARLSQQIIDIAVRRLRERILRPRSEGEEFQRILQGVVERRIDPFTAAQELMEDATAESPPPDPTARERIAVSS